MKLVNVTNSHSRLVLKQLENTDAYLAKVYTAGNTTIIYTEAPAHNEILLVNNKRNIQPNEINEVKAYFLKKIPNELYKEDEISIIELEGLVEISVPKHPSDERLAI
jgi:hypothetical protein